MMSDRKLRRRAYAFGILAATGAAWAALAAPAAAGRNEYGCPDEMIPVPAVLVQGGAGDHNGNGIICAKPAPDGRLHGGPEQMIDDFPL